MTPMAEPTQTRDQAQGARVAVDSGDDDPFYDGTILVIAAAPVVLCWAVGTGLFCSLRRRGEEDGPSAFHDPETILEGDGEHFPLLVLSHQTVDTLHRRNDDLVFQVRVLAPSFHFQDGNT